MSDPALFESKSESEVAVVPSTPHVFRNRPPATLSTVTWLKNVLMFDKFIPSYDEKMFVGRWYREYGWLASKFYANRDRILDGFCIGSTTIAKIVSLTSLLNCAFSHDMIERIRLLFNEFKPVNRYNFFNRREIDYSKIFSPDDYDFLMFALFGMNDHRDVFTLYWVETFLIRKLEAPQPIFGEKKFEDFEKKLFYSYAQYINDERVNGGVFLCNSDDDRIIAEIRKTLVDLVKIMKDEKKVNDTSIRTYDWRYKAVNKFFDPPRHYFMWDCLLYIPYYWLFGLTPGGIIAAFFTSCLFAKFIHLGFRFIDPRYECFSEWTLGLYNMFSTVYLYRVKSSITKWYTMNTLKNIRANITALLKANVINIVTAVLAITSLKIFFSYKYKIQEVAEKRSENQAYGRNATGTSPRKNAVLLLILNTVALVMGALSGMEDPYGFVRRILDTFRVADIAYSVGKGTEKCFNSKSGCGAEPTTNAGVFCKKCVIGEVDDVCKRDYSINDMLSNTAYYRNAIASLIKEGKEKSFVANVFKVTAFKNIFEDTSGSSRIENLQVTLLPKIYLKREGDNNINARSAEEAAMLADKYYEINYDMFDFEDEKSFVIPQTTDDGKFWLEFRTNSYRGTLPLPKTFVNIEKYELAYDPHTYSIFKSMLETFREKVSFIGLSDKNKTRLEKYWFKVLILFILIAFLIWYFCIQKKEESKMLEENADVETKPKPVKIIKRKPTVEKNAERAFLNESENERKTPINPVVVAPVLAAAVSKFVAEDSSDKTLTPMEKGYPVCPNFAAGTPEQCRIYNCKNCPKVLHDENVNYDHYDNDFLLEMPRNYKAGLRGNKSGQMNKRSAAAVHQQVDQLRTSGHAMKTYGAQDMDTKQAVVEKDDGKDHAVVERNIKKVIFKYNDYSVITDDMWRNLFTAHPDFTIKMLDRLGNYHNMVSAAEVISGRNRGYIVVFGNDDVKQFQIAKKYFTHYLGEKTNPFLAYIKASDVSPYVLNDLTKFVQRMNRGDGILPPLPILPKIDEDSPFTMLLNGYYVLKAPDYISQLMKTNDSTNIKVEKVLQWLGRASKGEKQMYTSYILVDRGLLGKLQDNFDRPLHYFVYMSTVANYFDHISTSRDVEIQREIRREVYTSGDKPVTKEFGYLESAEQLEIIQIEVEDPFYHNESFLCDDKIFPAVDPSSILAVYAEGVFNGNAVYCGNNTFITAWHVVKKDDVQYTMKGEDVRGIPFEIFANRVSLPDPYVTIDLAVLFVENLDVELVSVNLTSFGNKGKRNFFQTITRDQKPRSLAVNEHQFKDFKPLEIKYPYPRGDKVIMQSDTLYNVFYVGNTTFGYSGSGVFTSTSINGTPTMCGIHVRGGNNIAVNNFIGFSPTVIGMIKQVQAHKGMMKLIPSNQVIDPLHVPDLGKL